MGLLRKGTANDSHAANSYRRLCIYGNGGHIRTKRTAVDNIHQVPDKCLLQSIGFFLPLACCLVNRGQSTNKNSRRYTHSSICFSAEYLVRALHLQSFCSCELRHSMFCSGKDQALYTTLVQTLCNWNVLCKRLCDNCVIPGAI